MVLGELKLAGEVLLGPAAGEVPSWGRRRGSWMSRKLGREEEILGGGESGRGGKGGDPGEENLGEVGREKLGGEVCGEPATRWEATHLAKRSRWFLNFKLIEGYCCPLAIFGAVGNLLPRLTKVNGGRRSRR